MTDGIISHLVRGFKTKKGENKNLNGNERRKDLSVQLQQQEVAAGNAFFVGHLSLRSADL